MSLLKASEESIKYLTNHNCKLLLEIAVGATNKLNEKQEQLRHIKWQDGESNTDTDFSKLAGKCAEEAWLDMKPQYPLLSTITMVSKIPDINCTFSINDTIIKVPKNKIELKSSKSHVMSGSTIRKLDINQPLIYCKRPTNADGAYDIRCGQYHTAMGESDRELFQDRAPRPKINFRKLFSSIQMDQISYHEKEKGDWISHYGKCAINRLKNNVTNVWQDTLTKSIVYEAIKNIETMEDLIKLRESVSPPDIALKSVALCEQ
jgi:hypothetical protein